MCVCMCSFIKFSCEKYIAFMFWNLSFMLRWTDNYVWVFWVFQMNLSSVLYQLVNFDHDVNKSTGVRIIACIRKIGGTCVILI